MQYHAVKIDESEAGLARTEQLAWKIAEVAADEFPLTWEVHDAVVNRVIDTAGVAGAAINREPVVIARSEALARPYPGGASLFGLPNNRTFRAEWASWANTAAARDLDMNDTFLGADYAHPADNIPALIAVAQQCGKSGFDLARGIVTAYEIHIALAKSICLHKFKKDHVAHLAPAVVAGIGALLHLDVWTIYQAIQQAVHTSFACRQARGGVISSWKAFAPAHVAKLAIEAVDHALRGGQGPSPIYEGRNGIFAAMLGGAAATYEVPLPQRGEVRKAILESFPKQYSAEYHAQALIDLAFRVRSRIPDFDLVELITLQTSNHTHEVIGSGSDDPHKYDPTATRETLDHSAMYLFAVSLEDGDFHHMKSYLPERAQKASTKSLWNRIVTVESSYWTRRYHEMDPAKRAHGARVEIRLTDGKVISEELTLANAHPYGKRPFCRSDFVQKFQSLTEGIVADSERQRFLCLAENLPNLDVSEIRALNFEANGQLLSLPDSRHGIL